MCHLSPATTFGRRRLRDTTVLPLPPAREAGPCQQSPRSKPSDQSPASRLSLSRDTTMNAIKAVAVAAIVLAVGHAYGTTVEPPTNPNWQRYHEESQPVTYSKLTGRSLGRR